VKNLKLDSKIILVHAAVMLAIILAFTFVYNRVEYNFRIHKQNSITLAIDSLYRNIDHLVQLSKEGTLSTDEAQHRALDLVKYSRGDDGNYFWINDMDARIVLHPAQPELNGQDMSGFRVADGTFLFRKVVEIARTQQAGFIEYQWPKPGESKPVPKLSYVRGLPEWGWVIGSGLYLDDTYAELENIRNVFIGVSLVMLSLAVLMAGFARQLVSQPLSEAVEMIQEIGKGNLDSRLVLNRADEVGIMADELNKFADNMQHEILAAFECLAAGDFTFEASGVIRQPLEQTNRALAELIESKKRITAALLEQKTTIKLLLNSIAEGVYGLDQDGHCIFCNESALRLLGYEEHEFIGQPVHELIAHTRSSGSVAPREECLLEAILNRQKHQFSDEGIFWTGDGSWIEVEYRMQPIIRENRPVGAVVTFIDNSEKKKQLEQRLRTGQLVALGELSAGVAHEINNPISGVINYAQMLLNKGTSSEGEADILRRIIKEGERIASIVQNLLSFAHKDRDAQVPIRLQEIIHEPLALVRQRLVSEGIHLDVNLADDLPAILGNAQRIEQVLLNLINNSRHALNEKYPKSTPDKLLRISAQSVASGDQERLQLTIWDQGCGIPKKHLSRIFNTFFTTKPAGVGTGLGLSITHDIITEHDATISIESEHGLYTMVVMEFPIYRHRAPADQSTADPDRQRPHVDPGTLAREEAPPHQLTSVSG